MPLNPDQQLTAVLTETRLKATFSEGVPGPPGPPGPQGVPGIPSEVRDEGVALPARQSLNFVGAGVTATDDAAGGRTVITIPGASQTPWLQDIDAAGFDLNNLGAASFASVTEPGPHCLIQNDSGTLHLLADTGGSIDIESVGTGRVMVSTDATRRIVVRQNGNVGIGPSMNPSYPLDVQGDVNTSGVYRVNGVPLETGGGGAVDSVFGRAGVVVAQSGDYTAAQVTNAVSTLGSYADPAWITALSWDKITGEPSTFPPGTHTHAAADVTSGVFATARLGAGAADATVYLRGDGQWAAVSAGAAQTPWTQNIDAASFSLGNVSSIGIGIVAQAAPTKLYVAAGRAYFYANSEALGIYTAYNNSTAGFWIGGTTNADLAFTTQGGTERMRLTDLGQLGIRTATPFSRISFGTSNQNANSRIAFYESATGTTCRAVGMANPTGAVYGVAIWANTGGVVPSETNMHVFIADGGNVGIGTSAPASLLHVNSAGNSAITLESGVAWSPFMNLKRGATEWWIGVGIDGSNDFNLWDALSARFLMTMTVGGGVKLFLGGSLKTLSVDGSGFVKAA